MPLLPRALFVACGSVNPVTLRQMQTAEEAGFVHIHLNPVQKLEPSWLESRDCESKIKSWLEQAAGCRRCILDVNDPEGRNDTAEYAAEHGLTTEDLRVRISTQLAHLMKRLLDSGLDATHPLHRRRYALGPDAHRGRGGADAGARACHRRCADQLCLPREDLPHHLKIRRIRRACIVLWAGCFGGSRKSKEDILC